jgi:NitT/TauT family transport system permease protein
LYGIRFLLTREEIHIDILTTLYRVFCGFSLAIISSIPLGLIIGKSLRLKLSLEVLIDFFRSIPSITLYPLFLLAFGLGNISKIAVSSFVCFWVILISTINGVTHSSKTRQQVALSLGCNSRCLIFDVILMDALPQIASGLRVAVSISLTAVIAAEMLMGSNHGLGQRIYDYYLTYRIPNLYAALIITGILGYVFNKTLALLEKKLIHWTGK